MENEIPIKIMIHDLNPWGGQDRSVLEIAWELNKYHPMEIHSYTLDGPKIWPNMKHVKYEALIKKPILFKYLDFHLKSLRSSNDSEQLTQSTGTASLKSQIIQVHFVHHAWFKVAKNLIDDQLTQSSIFKKTYKALLNFYKLKLEKNLYTPDKYYVAVSHTIKKELIEHFPIPESQITVIHHGVDLNYFKPVNPHDESQKVRGEIRKSLDIIDDDLVFLHVGALNSRKGLFQTLKLLSHLKKSGFKNIKYLAVGQGHNKILEDLILKEDLQDWVKIVPHSKNIRNYYWASDLLFFPTFYEPFGLVVLEAMASGLPCFISQIAGAAELIDDGHDGLLFNPKDPVEEIADKILPYIKSPQLRKDLATQGLMKVQDFTWDKVGRKYSEFYKGTWSFLQKRKKT